MSGVSYVAQAGVDYFAERRPGDLIVRLVDDIAVVEGAVASGPASLVTSGISIIVFAVAALVIRWDLALVAFAVAPAFWLLARGFSGPLNRAANVERTASGSVTSVVEESLANQALIQAWPGPSCGTRPCWSWTSRPPAWTPPARSACWR